MLSPQENGVRWHFDDREPPQLLSDPINRWSCLCQKAKTQHWPKPWAAPQHEPNIKADLPHFGGGLKVAVAGHGWAGLGSLPKKCWSSMVKWRMESTAFHRLMSIIMPAQWEPHICPVFGKNKNSSMGTECEKSPRAD